MNSPPVRSACGVALMLVACACTSLVPNDPAPVDAQDLRVLFRVAVMSMDNMRPAVDEQRVIASTLLPNKFIVAFDRLTGAELWRTPRPDGSPRNVSISAGRVLFAGQFAVALSVETGEEIWRTELPGNSSLCETAAHAGHFVVGTDHEVFAFDIADGSQIWRTPLGEAWEFRAIARGMSIAGDTVFAVIERFRSVNGELSQAHIVAMELRTGKVLWTHVEGDGQRLTFASSSVLVTEQYVVFGDIGGNVMVALDRNSGEPVWRTPGEPGYYGAFSPPSRSGDTLFVSSGDSWLRALDLHSGAVLWAAENGSSLFSQELCGKYVLALDSRVNVHERSTGRILQKNVGNESAPLSSRLVRFQNDVYVFGVLNGYGIRCG